ncbi:hypothetical protein F5Y17DRAFT_457737 [Xylariaceae sp. FL0594]|nr:hypothetical protein F5Y17DRAFT_457737 [Xylariaceae sp. FL0594]
MFTTKSTSTILLAAAAAMFAPALTSAAAIDARDLDVNLPGVNGTGPVEHAAQLDFWAQFCDDTQCSQNCGESVKVSNPGCLNEGGRQSILFHGADLTSHGDFSLVVSPSGDCPCQDTCTTVPANFQCWDISQYSAQQSFRFIGGHCSSNNC